MAAKKSSNRPDWMTPKAMAIGGGIGVAFIAVVILNIMMNRPTVIPMDPIETTRNRIAKIESAAIAFITGNQTMPGGLADVAKTPDDVDGWKKPFTFTPGTEGSKKTSFVIQSNGADGQPGTPDDWTTKVTFGNDGYGKLGTEKITKVEPPQ